MKQFIIVIGMAVIIILISMTLLSVESKTDRQEELNRVVSTAVKQTVEISQIKNQKEINSDKEMVAYFVHIMSLGISSQGDISIEVMESDYEEGMLDVLVKQKFKYLNGEEDIISVRKCAIYE